MLVPHVTGEGVLIRELLLWQAFSTKVDGSFFLLLLIECGHIHLAFCVSTTSELASVVALALLRAPVIIVVVAIIAVAVAVDQSQ